MHRRVTWPDIFKYCFYYTPPSESACYFFFLFWIFQDNSPPQVCLCAEIPAPVQTCTGSSLLASGSILGLNTLLQTGITRPLSARFRSIYSYFSCSPGRESPTDAQFTGKGPRIQDREFKSARSETAAIFPRDSRTAAAPGIKKIILMNVDILREYRLI